MTADDPFTLAEVIEILNNDGSGPDTHVEVFVDNNGEIFRVDEAVLESSTSGYERIIFRRTQSQ